MKTILGWKSGMQFVAKTREHELMLDATYNNGGMNTGPSPKEFVLQGVAGCTAMDVIFYLKKYKLEPLSFEVSAEADLTEGVSPVRFKDIKIKYKLLGDLPIEKVKAAVQKSMTQYCGVSYMLSRSCPINYSIELNGDIILTDAAKFD